MLTAGLLPQWLPILRQCTGSVRGFLTGIYLNELGSKFTECTKLVPNLHKKERYIIHYRNLKLYQSLGMQVTKTAEAEYHLDCKFTCRISRTQYKTAQIFQNHGCCIC